jgi:hypothetical protein
MRSLIVALITRMLSLEMNALNVRLEMFPLSEPLPTLAAGEVADFLMHRKDMLLEIYFLTKFCTAGGTLKLPYFIMYSLHMQVNVTLCREFPLASIAQKGTSLLLIRLSLTLVNLSDFLRLGELAVHPMVGQQTAAGKTYAAGGTQMDISRPVLLSTESVQALKKR